MSNGNAFAITTDMAGGIELEPGQQRRVVFNVQNISGRPLEGRARIQTEMPAQQAWYTIEGRTENHFQVDEVHQYAVQVEIPPDAQEGRYAVQLQCAWVDRPEDLFGSSAKVLVVVDRAASPDGGPPIWVWFVAAGVVLAVLGGVALWFFTRPDVEVPKVVELAEDSAVAVLNDLELVPRATPRPTIGQVGTVLEQAPDSGTMVDAGDTVDFIVAQRAALMPDLEGDSWISATGQISDLQLPVSLRTTTQGLQDSSVHEQFPSEGDTITIGDSLVVTFTVPPQIFFPFPHDSFYVLPREFTRNLRTELETGPEIEFDQLPGVIDNFDPNP